MQPGAKHTFNEWKDFIHILMCERCERVPTDVNMGIQWICEPRCCVRRWRFKKNSPRWKWWREQRIERPSLNRHQWIGILQFFLWISCCLNSLFLPFYILPFAFRYMCVYLGVENLFRSLKSLTSFLLYVREYFLLVQLLSHTSYLIRTYALSAHISSLAMQWNQYETSEWTFQREQNARRF